MASLSAPPPVLSVSYTHLDALYHENGYYESIDLIGSDLSLLNQINKPQLCGGGEIENFSGYQAVSYTHLDVYKRQCNNFI